MPEDLEKKENQLADFEALKAEREKLPEEKEKIPAPETKPEGVKIGGKEEVTEEEEGGIKIKAPVAPVVPQYKSPTLVQIEDILEEDLGDAYFSMSPKRREDFKKKGEETASRIEKLVEAVKINSTKILGLIKKWLKLIPGINRFFLEQEAKIKTDKILNLRERK